MKNLIVCSLLLIIAAGNVHAQNKEDSTKVAIKDMQELHKIQESASSLGTLGLTFMAIGAVAGLVPTLSVQIGGAVLQLTGLVLVSISLLKQEMAYDRLEDMRKVRLKW